MQRSGDAASEVTHFKGSRQSVWLQASVGDEATGVSCCCCKTTQVLHLYLLMCVWNFWTVRLRIHFNGRSRFLSYALAVVRLVGWLVHSQWRYLQPGRPCGLLSKGPWHGELRTSKKHCMACWFWRFFFWCWWSTCRSGWNLGRDSCVDARGWAPARKDSQMCERVRQVRR